ncbi:MAG: response regulator [Planctomycetaceae bacterium]|nr:response regulator [Planctomycetaceae bacterium]
MAPNAVLVVAKDAEQGNPIVQGLASVIPSSRVSVAGSTEEARGRLEELRAKTGLPAFVLVDLSASGSSGLEVLTWLRSRPEYQPVPVVVMHSEHDGIHVDRAYKAGANSCLVRPGKSAELRQLLQAIATYWICHNVSRGANPSSGGRFLA